MHAVLTPFSSQPHLRPIFWVTGWHVHLLGMSQLPSVLCPLTLSFYLLQTVKENTGSFLTIIVLWDIVHLQRSGMVLRLPKFYIILENWVNWKYVLVLSSLLVRDGTSDILHFKLLCWSAIKSWAKPILWSYQPFEFANTPSFHTVCLHKYSMHLSLKPRLVIVNFKGFFSRSVTSFSQILALIINIC